MRVFVSSLITGMEPFRAAAREAISTLRHEPIMAEDFGARPDSPQVACLNGLRESDIVVLIVGEHYGAIQPSGRSATHEEYDEARGHKTILAFVQEGVDREPREEEFAREVQAWTSGLFRSGFRTVDELRQTITRALYDHALARATGPVDQEEMTQRAVALLPAEQRNYASSGASLNLSVAGGPRQSILRPVEIERATLAEALMQQGMFGTNRLFETAQGVQHTIQNASLVLTQERGAQVLLTEEGLVVISMPVRRTGQMGMELVEEAVQAQFAAALAYTSWTLDHIDPTQRLTHVAIAASITGGDYMAWRTQAESDASPNRMSLGMGNNAHTPVHISKARPALRLNAAHIVEDLLVPLRRQRR